MINKHKSNKIKENSNTVRHLNNGTDHRHSKSCCDQSSPVRRTIKLRITCIWWGKSTGDRWIIPRIKGNHKGPVMWKALPCHDVTMNAFSSCRVCECTREIQGDLFKKVLNFKNVFLKGINEGVFVPPILQCGDKLRNHFTPDQDTFNKHNTATSRYGSSLNTRTLYAAL